MQASALRRALVSAAVAAAVFGAACGTPDSTGTAAKDIKQLPADKVSGTFLGLTPSREDITETLSSQEANAYIDAIGLYSLRNGERLEATLQISKLSSKARPDSDSFQQQVAGQIGGTRTQAFKVGGRNVYRSSQRKQSLSSWFKNGYFMVLAVRDTYATPRALLRVLLEEVSP